MKETYVFPAIFTQESAGIAIEFPDLPGCLPCADNYTQAFHHAREALHLHLSGMIEDGESIPMPSKLENIRLEDGAALALIETQLL